MKQKLITNDSLVRFDGEVNRALQDGWRIVPSTLVISSASRGSDTYRAVETACAVVVEKE